MTTDPICHRCEGPIDSHQYGHSSTVELQYELYVETYGGYMSFRDDLFEDPPQSVLCHDCAVEFYRWMGFDPKNPDFRGLHPDRNDGEPGTPMCCEYAWRGATTTEKEDL